MQWFRKAKTGISALNKKDTPADIWVQCDSCKEALYKKDLVRSDYVCEYCGYHFRITAPEYIRLLLDEKSFVEWDADLRSTDPLKFVAKKKYKDSLIENEKKTGLRSAVVSGIGQLRGNRVSIGVMDYRFIGGSLGSVEGEKLSRVIRRSMELKIPAIIISASGGARMQEGALSLMQMAKTSAYLGRLDQAGLPFFSILTNPTFGGVTASYAMLGDLIISEPGAVIGFAGPRVIKETIRQELPQGFQTAEFLLNKGFIDSIVSRSEMKNSLANLIELLANKKISS